jgi:hypothetical protein
VPVWALIALGVGFALLIGGLAIGAVFASRGVFRRYLVRLVSRAGEIDAARRAVDDIVARIAVESDAQLEHFADDPDAGERRALKEMAGRAKALADELDGMPVPKRLVPAAEALGDAAYVIQREAGKIPDAARGREAIDALGTIELSDLGRYWRVARDELERVSRSAGIALEMPEGRGLYL